MGEPAPGPGTSPAESLESLRAWMRGQGWDPLPHQEATWAAYGRGEEGLVRVPTGMGKTYAAYFGPLAQAAADAARGGGSRGSAALGHGPRNKRRIRHTGLRILWLTPLRAMARDLERALTRPVEELGLPVTVGARTSDTSSYRKKKLREQLPTVLLTTPESLTILLSYPDAGEKFTGVDAVVVDEWHELVGSKRGTQTELALARLRRWSPGMRTWCLSATLGDPEGMARAALAPTTTPTVIDDAPRVLPEIRTLLGPESVQLPWFGHYGGAMVGPVAETLDPDISTLVFTNTRSQAERWRHDLCALRPEWESRMAVHHGSVDRERREAVEAGISSGDLGVVVCTSSLDLGVDFAPVQRVVQVGSARGVARLLQRAGRSGHRPGARSEIWMVPTHAMQLPEIAGLRACVEAGEVETRRPLEAPLDVLIQHLVTCAVGGGFEEDALYEEVRGAWSYRDLPRDRFDWAVDFVERGGKLLGAYPQFHRIVREEDRCVLHDTTLVKRHRAAIGTITEDGHLSVKFANGKRLGQVEERYVTRLKRGERFLFAGRVLEVMSIRGMELRVKAARGRTDHVPRWLGGRMPVSEVLGARTRAIFSEVRTRVEAGEAPAEVCASMGPEMARVGPVMEVLHERARIPGPRLLAELVHTQEGDHLFLFTFAGQLANEGLASLLAWRLSRGTAVTFSMSANDYGIELLASGGFDFETELRREGLFSLEQVDAHALQAVNAAELARRQFREIARIAGLVIQGFGRHRKGARQLQTSAGLVHDVFERYEPDHPLLEQARAEVLDRCFDRRRLRAVLEEHARTGVEVVRPSQPSPLAFPLLLERVEARISTESMRARVERMKTRWTSDLATAR